MTKPMMKCGHTANGKINGKPCCLICYGIKDGATEVAKESDLPNLEGRVAKCAYCENTQPSSFKLAFFEYKSNEKYDKYYCGCRGWN